MKHWDWKLNFGRPILNKFSSLDPLSYPLSSHPEIRSLHYCFSTHSLSHLSALRKHLESSSHLIVNLYHFLSLLFWFLNPKKLTSLSKHELEVLGRSVWGSLYYFLIKNFILPIFWIFLLFSCISIYFIVNIYFYG